MDKNQKEILLDQILGLLNSNNGGDRDSLRYTAQYNQANLSKNLEHELQEIDFTFLDQPDMHHEEWMPHNISRVSTANKKIPPQLQQKQLKEWEEKYNRKEKVQAQLESSEDQNTSRAKTKKTYKLSERLHKKISLKEQTDQFTKKYDSLFDEVFFENKMKVAPVSSKPPSEPEPAKNFQKQLPKQSVVQIFIDDNKKINTVTTNQVIESSSKPNVKEATSEYTSPIIKNPNEYVINKQDLNIKFTNSSIMDEKGQQQPQVKLNPNQLDNILRYTTSATIDQAGQHQLAKVPTQKTLSGEDNHQNKILSNSMQSNNPKITEPIQLGFHSMSSLQQNAQPDKYNRQFFQNILQEQGNNNELINSFKPKVKITFQDKKQPQFNKPHIIYKTDTNKSQPQNISFSQSNTQNTLNIQPNTLNIQGGQFSYLPANIQPNSVITQPIVERPKSQQPHPNINIIQPIPQPANSNKTFIKFNYNALPKVQQISPNKQEIVFLNIKPKQDKKQQNIIVNFKQKEEIRLPIFLRRLRQLTNSYPNFYSTNLLTNQSCQKLNKQLQQSYSQCKKAFKILKTFHLKYHQLLKATKELYQRINLNVAQKKGSEDSELLSLFINKEWKSIAEYPEIIDIKPHDLFQKRKMNQLEFMTLLKSYEELVEEMEKQSGLNLTDPKSFKSYMDCRQKLWALQKNLRIMSEDLYIKAIVRTNLPQHMIQSLEIIRNKKKLTSSEKTKHVERLLFLQQKKDSFALSCLGQHTLKLLLAQN